MALPASGPISGSQIATELGIAAWSNLSLGGLIASSSISNTNPDKYSEFYGYSNVTYTQVYRDDAIGKPQFGCMGETYTSVWHNGGGILPSTGDTLYTNSAGSSTISSGNWPVGFGFQSAISYVYTTNSSGYITTAYLCDL